MCAIFGVVLTDGDRTTAGEVNEILGCIADHSLGRGRDGRGWVSRALMKETPGLSADGFRSTERAMAWFNPGRPALPSSAYMGSLIGNTRAEPTTEFIADKASDDQQPYSLGSWSIVHNGTIANDADLRTGEYKSDIDSAAIVEALDAKTGSLTDRGNLQSVFAEVISELRGSYAILAVHRDQPNMILAACNYRPIWYAVKDGAIYIASARSYFPSDILTPQMVRPYSICVFSSEGPIYLNAYTDINCKALVVCSGGLDSVVAATWAVRNGYDVELLHFQYGCRPEVNEGDAISKVAEALGVNVRYMPMDIYSPQDSNLLQPDSKLAGGEAGAEFAHEWVPARNLVMLALATAYAEAQGRETIILGNNLEEAGAYPDNEPEFIDRFNDMLPFAVRDGAKLQVLMPVGNLMKHEIVKLGFELDAPLQHTWSCYRAGKRHCGKCGPCFMRRTAFEINGLNEVIEYERNN